MDFVKDDQVEEGRRELAEHVAQGLECDSEEAVAPDVLNGVRQDTSAGLIGDEVLKPLGEGLAHQGIPVGDEQDLARLVAAQEDVGESHRDAGLAGAGGHDQEGAASLVLLKGLAEAAHSLDLVGAVDDRLFGLDSGEGDLQLPDVQQAPQILAREKRLHLSLGGAAHVPEVDLAAVGHERKGAKALALLDLGDVELGLSLGQPRIEGRALRLDDGDDVAVGKIEHVVADAFGQPDGGDVALLAQLGDKPVPRLGVILVGGDLDADLRLVPKIPARFLQGRVDEISSSLRLT